MLKKTVNFFNLFLSLGAFYLGLSMFLGKGIFATFPPEWVGIMPFSNWASLALFGIIVFGIGNAMTSIYGFLKKDKKIFTLTFILGMLLFLCALMPIVLLGEWYLPTVYFFILSFFQILLGFFGLVTKKK